MPTNLTTPQLQHFISELLSSLPPHSYLNSDEYLLLNTSQALPHSSDIGKVNHIIWRTADSIPQEKARQLQEEIRDFSELHPLPWTEPTIIEYDRSIGKQYNNLIDRGYGKCHLKQPEIRRVICECLMNLPSSIGEVYAFAVMPNHVHAIILNLVELPILMKDLKGISAAGINRLTGESGSYWHKNYYDRMMRNPDHLKNTIHYVVNNPRYIQYGQYSLWLRGIGEINWNSEFLKR